MSLLLSHEQCYQALHSRDARFDGRFFSAVISTGIYCRPICPVRTPKFANCRFFASAAAAEAAGFRPCMRCRPELAPGNAKIDATARIAQRAASLIEEGFLNEANITQLAKQLNVTDRHLRRVFQAEFNASLIAYAQTQRLLLAKHLLTDTALPIIDVALAAGFSSVRRFNSLFKQRYRLSPSALRRTTLTVSETYTPSFILHYRPPLDWHALINFLADRAIPGVEHVDNGIYRRTVHLYHQDCWHTGWLAVELLPKITAVRVTLANELRKAIVPILVRIKRLFDLDCSPDKVVMELGSLMESHPGLRVPGAFDGFEMAVRAILGQQVTVKAACTLAGRLVSHFGETQVTPFITLTYTFPTPERIAATSVEAIAALGILRSRASAIMALARAIVNDQLQLTPNADIPSTLKQLQAMPGIGDWTSQYIAMRALAWPDAFPTADAGIMKALGTRSPATIESLSQAWRPWRAYAVMQLWFNLTESKS